MAASSFLVRVRDILLVLLLVAMVASGTAEALRAQEGAVAAAPERRPGEGRGPFDRLVIRGVTLLDGTGAPAQEPMDIVIEGNRIASVHRVGYPGVPIDPSLRPELRGGEELEAQGLFLLPGFVDMHAHVGGAAQGVCAEYVYKLWMGHGVTTVREAGADNGLEWTLRESRRSARNEIVAPRFQVYVRPGVGWEGRTIRTPEDARVWVRSVAGIDGVRGLKLGAEDPEIMEALIDEAGRHGLGTTAHLTRVGIPRMNILDAAKLGLGSTEHVLGLFEALFDERTVPELPPGYRPEQQQLRFLETGRLWRQSAPPGSPRWNAVLDTLLMNGLVLDPTLAVYDVARDVSRARRAVWHQEYTLPALREFFEPARDRHAAFYLDWSHSHEVEWKRTFDRWMRFLDDYKDRGGRVTAGSDAGWMYNVYGFTFVRELELLEEAGFHPLEVLRAATLWGAETLEAPTGAPPEYGVVRPGMLADLQLVDGDPSANLKLLYGTGHLRLNDETGEPERVGGVRWVVKDGVLYDAARMRAEVREMVRRARAEGVERGCPAPRR